MQHETKYVSATRGERGRRTVYFGYCSCGAGTTTSASSASVERKLRAHAAGDDSGIYKTKVAATQEP